MSRPPLALVRTPPDQPDPPDAAAAPRPRGSRRPHTDRKVAEVRRLIEDTAMTYGEIAQRTGVGRASICRWTRDQNWQRHPFAPRATDTVKSERAGARLKARTLAARLQALAERHIRELEASATVDQDKLGEALELMTMARLAARTRRGRTRPDPAVDDALPSPHRPEQYARAVIQLCAADVSLRRAPRAAVEDYIDSREPISAEERRRQSRGRRLTREQRHRLMLEPWKG